MYSICLFCHHPLGRNDLIEAFPIGRRLAYDVEKGRLWVVCRGCSRWNLTPLEERWEALEECERLYRGTRLRVATENIGLARLRDGTELIRIGRPLRPEFAAWRYADQFGRRRRRAAWGAGLGALAVVSIATGSAVLTGGGAAVGVLANVGFHLYGMARAKLHPPPHIRTEEGQLVQVAEPWLGMVRIRPGEAPEKGWELVLPNPGGQDLTLRGRHAHAAAAILLPRINRTGASKTDVKAAVQELELVANPLDYFTQAEFRARKRGYGYNPLAQMPKPIRLALEMASHEETERRAMEGELVLLEQAWKDAEQIAAIADSLALPTRIEARLRRYRTRRLT